MHHTHAYYFNSAFGTSTYSSTSSLNPFRTDVTSPEFRNSYLEKTLREQKLLMRLD